MSAVVFWGMLLLVVAGAGAAGDAGGRGPDAPAGHSDRGLALKLKLVAMAAVLFSGAVGSSAPWIQEKFEQDPLGGRGLKSFTGGIILSTGLLHVLPDSFASLAAWSSFPFAGLFCMVGIVATLVIDNIASSFLIRRAAAAAGGQLHPAAEDEEGGAAAHVHAHVARNRLMVQVLEVGVVVHSIIIGFSIGISSNPEAIKSLAVAISFHQLFEGFGLGGMLLQAKLSRGAMLTAVSIFSLTTPVGVGIGMAVSAASYTSGDSPATAILQGLMKATSAGILIYLSLVELLAQDMASVLGNVKMQCGLICCMILGSSLMAAIALWA